MLVKENSFIFLRFEGIVVAKEHEDVLMDAWQRDEEETQRKEKEVSFRLRS